MHDRVADHRHGEDVIECDLRLARHIRRQGVECCAYRVGHLLCPARIHHRVGDTAHQVFAETDLRVHGAGRGHDFAAFQVAQVGRNGRRADIDRHSVHGLVETRQHRDDLRACVHGDRDLPLALAQCRLQLLQHVQVCLQGTKIPFPAQRLEQALQVAGWVVHVRFAHLHVA
jgi:hypothetical protein